MSVEVGTKVTGKISGITNFGAFVDLGDKQTGLVHISEVSDGFVKDIHDVLAVGDEVQVKILSVGDDGKIALSIRKAMAKKPSAKEHKPYKKHEGDNIIEIAMTSGTHLTIPNVIMMVRKKILTPY